jgi:ribose transport system permease protein
VGVPYSAQTIIQALALGFGIGVYSVRWTASVIKQTKPTLKGGNNEVLG